jgi:tight adherence protein B
VYIFGAIGLYMKDRRKNYIKRILRLSENNSISKNDKGNKDHLKKIKLWLKKNNIDIEIEEFFILLSILLSIVIIVGILNAPNPIIAVLLSVFMAFILFIYINIRKKRENLKKEEQLEQFLLDFKGNLYSYPNILNSLEKTIPEVNYPLKRDFEIVLDDTKRGLLLNESLKNMIKRNSSYLIETILKGLIIANDKGVDLINFLDDQINYLREKRNIDNYIKILSSGPKYTAYLIMIIPLIAIVIVILINRNIIDILFSGFGLIILSYVIISNAIGIFLINRMVNFQNESRQIR